MHTAGQKLFSRKLAFLHCIHPLSILFELNSY
jgi:hypothetical protein